MHFVCTVNIVMKLNAVTILTACILASSWTLVRSARILAVLPFYAKSHHNFMQPLLLSLAKAGHQLTVYSPFPLDSPHDNYTEIILDYPMVVKEQTQVVLKLMKSPHWMCLDDFPTSGKKIFKALIENKKIKELIISKERFDLVITEAFSVQESTLIFGHIFQAPVIALQAFFTNNVVNSVFGNSLSLTYIPDACTPFSDRMTFYERLLNSIYSLRGLYYIYYYKHLPEMDRLVRSHFPGIPPLQDMVNNVSLIFVNDHMTADYAQPRPPNVIPVSGIHVLPERPLPRRIKKFVDNATDGVLIFSLGTYVPDHLQPKEYFEIFIKVFSKLKQKVMWKTKKDHIDGLPENVMLSQWLPQRDILAHPNCVLFITHCGLLSQHETIHAAVPVVAIPQFYDQHRNARFYEEKGVGVRLFPEELSEETLSVAIKEVLENSKYKENMLRLSRIFKDRPLSPAQTVVYWTEYVLRHGAAHLKPVASQLSFYQRALLDVAAAIVVLVSVVAVSVYFVTREIIRKFFFKHNEKESLTKKLN